MTSNSYHSCWAVVAVALLSLLSGCSSQEIQANSPKESAKPSGVQFSCHRQTVDGTLTYVTTVTNDGFDEDLTVIVWDPNNDRFGEWTPEKRCEKVSQRFQTIHDRNGISFMTADIARWHPNQEIKVICGVARKGDRCNEEDLLFTLETQDDPNEVLEEIVAFKTNPSTVAPLTRGSEAVSFDDGQRVYYDLKQQIEKAQKESKPAW